MRCLLKVLRHRCGQPRLIRHPCDHPRIENRQRTFRRPRDLLPQARLLRYGQFSALHHPAIARQKLLVLLPRGSKPKSPRIPRHGILRTKRKIRRHRQRTHRTIRRRRHFGIIGRQHRPSGRKYPRDPARSDRLQCQDEATTDRTAKFLPRSHLALKGLHFAGWRLPRWLRPGNAGQ